MNAIFSVTGLVGISCLYSECRAYKYKGFSQNERSAVRAEICKHATLLPQLEDVVCVGH